MEHQFSNYYMEARALKSKSLVEQFQQQQGLYDQDLLCFDTTTNTNALFSSGSEDFSVVDCFFDFSNNTNTNNNNTQHVVVVQKEEEEEEEEEEHFDDDGHSNSTSSGFSDSVFVSELAVPDDNLADLEWVSHFVDDYLPELSDFYPFSKPEKKTESHARNRRESEPKPALTRSSCILPSLVPVKPRTKRSRPTSRTWSVAEPLVESSSLSSTSLTSSTASNQCLVSASTIDLSPNSGESLMKKPKKKPSGQTGGSAQFQRRCSHCHVQKTPQWRTGPLGAKTLCNACGVRYKSGRLFPEYRPACSPTFSSGTHSNSHRKVLELRNKKEPTTPQTSLKHMVPSF